MLRALREILRERRPDLVFLMETRKRVDQMDGVLRKLDVSFGCFTVNRERSGGGGLVLLWRNDWNVRILSYSPGHIDARVTTNDNFSCRFTGFYGNPIHAFRHHSWELLRRLANVSNEPWILGGDFNEILRDEEKSGRRLRSLNQMLDFQEAIDYCDLREVDFIGAHFTWDNRQKGNENVKEGLTELLLMQRVSICSSTSTLDILLRELLVTFQSLLKLGSKQPAGNG